MGVDVDQKYGGTGASFLATILAVEELAKFDPSVSIIMDVQNTLCISTFKKYASEEQKQKYLPRLCKDTVSFDRSSHLFFILTYQIIFCLF